MNRDLVSLFSAAETLLQTSSVMSVDMNEWGQGVKENDLIISILHRLPESVIRALFYNTTYGKWFLFRKSFICTAMSNRTSDVKVMFRIAGDAILLCLNSKIRTNETRNFSLLLLLLEPFKQTGSSKAYKYTCVASLRSQSQGWEESKQFPIKYGNEISNLIFCCTFQKWIQWESCHVIDSRGSRHQVWSRPAAKADGLNPTKPQPTERKPRQWLSVSDWVRFFDLFREHLTIPRRKYFSFHFFYDQPFSDLHSSIPTSHHPSQGSLKFNFLCRGDDTNWVDAKTVLGERMLLTRVAVFFPSLFPWFAIKTMLHYVRHTMSKIWESNSITHV